MTSQNEQNKGTFNTRSLAHIAYFCSNFEIIYLLSVMNRGIKTVATSAFCCLVALTGCKKQQQAMDMGSYKTMTVKTESRELQSRYSASIKGRQDVDIYPQVSGTLQKLCVKEGDRVTVRLRGELKEYPGRIGALNPVAVKFRDSTLVQALGGIVACYPNQKTREFTPVNVLYCITVIPDEPILCRAGRTGQAEVKKSYRMSVELVRSLMHIFYREFSF